MRRAPLSLVLAFLAGSFAFFSSFPTADIARAEWQETSETYDDGSSYTYGHDGETGDYSEWYYNADGSGSSYESYANKSTYSQWFADGSSSSTTYHEWGGSTDTYTNSDGSYYTSEYGDDSSTEYYYDADGTLYQFYESYDYGDSYYSVYGDLYSETSETYDYYTGESESETIWHDTDGDGLTNYDEEFTYGTEIDDPDTDGDGHSDSEEVAGGTNPIDPNDPPSGEPTGPDDAPSGIYTHPETGTTYSWNTTTSGLFESWSYTDGSYESSALYTNGTVQTDSQDVEGNYYSSTITSDGTEYWDSHDSNGESGGAQYPDGSEYSYYYDSEWGGYNEEWNYPDGSYDSYWSHDEYSGSSSYDTEGNLVYWDESGPDYSIWGDQYSVTHEEWDWDRGETTDSETIWHDTDLDGLTDYDEDFIYATARVNHDTDGDLMNDGWEVANGLDPLNPDDAFTDLDSDGISNVLEALYQLNPASAETVVGSPDIDVFQQAAGGQDLDGNGQNDSEQAVNQGTIPVAGPGTVTPSKPYQILNSWVYATYSSNTYSNPIGDGGWGDSAGDGIKSDEEHYEWIGDRDYRNQKITSLKSRLAGLDLVKSTSESYHASGTREVSGSASVGDGIEGDYDFSVHSFSWYHIQLERGSAPITEEITKTWVKITKGEDGSQEGVTIEKLTIKANDTKSGILILDPPDGKMISLLPLEVVDINDHSDEGDDVSISPWDTSQQITNENIAWIDAHTSQQDDSPRMPQLELRIPGLPSGITIEAKLEVEYTRGNGAREPRTQPGDRVQIPGGDSFAPVTGDTWRIYDEPEWAVEIGESPGPTTSGDQGFFGGDATLTYRLLGEDGAEVLAPQTINFRIGGESPEPARGRTYIETLEEAGPDGNLWFTYAVAKSESADYNGEDTRYNQFYSLPEADNENYADRRRTHVGRPVFGDDRNADGSPNGPGGYGMFQVTGSPTNADVDISRGQIWNWQVSSVAALAIISRKRNTDDVVNGFPVGADAWMDRQENASNANGTAIPDHTVSSVTFSESTSQDIRSACTIKLYNGGSRPGVNFTDPGTVPGFLLGRGSGQYCYWDNGQSAWALSRFNNHQFNYVERVCGEVE